MWALNLLVVPPVAAITAALITRIARFGPPHRNPFRRYF